MGKAKVWKTWTVEDRVKVGDQEMVVKTKIKARSQDELTDKMDGWIPTVRLEDGTEVMADEVISTEIVGWE